MFLHQLDLTTALRPSLLPEETLLFVQDAVGLYEGYVVARVLARPSRQDILHFTQLTVDIANTRFRSIKMDRHT